MNDRFDIIDAFVDGESVDPSALKEALAEPAGRDHLVDAWLLREVVQDEIASDVPVPMPRPSPRSGQSWALAAAIAGISLLSGYIVGVSLPNVLGPRPADTQVTQPGRVTKPGDVNIPATSFPVPVPTRVIRLELDANWREAGGGD